jgi:hypothetical protein
MVGRPTLQIDFDAITGLLLGAERQGRQFLFEFETYQLLASSGAETPPRTHLLLKGSRPSDEELTAMPGDKVVLKIVSPTIIHKTEVGGVRVVAKTPDKIRYDPLVDELMAKGMAVFRSSDRAVQALAMYIEGRLQAERLRSCRQLSAGF